MNIDAAAYPEAFAFVEELRSINDRFILPQIETLADRFGDDYLRFLNKLVGLSRAVGGKPVDAILAYTMIFLREQVMFLKTETYSNSDFDDVYKKVYNNPDVMEAFYLDALMLSKACWETHFLIHRFFQESFLPLCRNASQGLEVGFGHGYFLYELLEFADVSKVFGIDISDYSVRYAEKLLSTAFPRDRFSLAVGDIQRRLPFDDGAMAFGLLPEVLEHIPDPRKGLTEMHRCLAPGAPLFVITPMNSNSLDHITNYQSIEEIEEMGTTAGFTPKTKKVFAVKDIVPKSKDKTVYYLGVLEKS